MNLPVFSQLAGNFRFSETGSLETASSSGESVSPVDSGAAREKSRASRRSIHGWRRETGWADREGWLRGRRHNASDASPAVLRLQLREDPGPDRSKPIK